MEISTKILIIENNLAGGGAEKVLLTILEELTPPMYDVTLLLIKNKGVYMNSIPKHIKVKYMLDVDSVNCSSEKYEQTSS